MSASIPFLYGAQYYRAPTPSPDHWDSDLADMKRRGFNTVKFWVQWRWSEPAPNSFYWDDLDALLRLAEKHGLRVVLNLILDVMPTWLEATYPDCLMVDRHGRPLHGEAIPYRQLGGYPGPCYSHRETTALRQRFTRAAVAHFRSFPALFAWDVWNEPERHGSDRSGAIPDLCFCPSCKAQFRSWVHEKYRSIDTLNRVWGRCYPSFDAVEIPTNDSGCVQDFVDWRTFQSDLLHRDAAWRLDIVRELDPSRHPHLHVVVDTGALSPVTGVDDFTIARPCELFGSTMQNDPYACAQGISAAQGRPFYNAEWHIHYGSLSCYPRLISRDFFLSEQLAQLGWGIRGFLFWQYRTETLGTEAPAWGLVRPDSSPRPTLLHATEFLSAFLPYAEHYAQCTPAHPQVLLWRDAANERFQQARYGHQRHFHDSARAYCQALYALNIPYQFVDSALLEAASTGDARVLIVPQGMYLNTRETNALQRWVSAGKTLLVEGNLASYSSDTNRFSDHVPGNGLSSAWGLCESEYTATCHLPKGGDAVVGEWTGPLSGTTPPPWFALDLLQLKAPSFDILATCHSWPVIVQKNNLFYAGSQLGVAAAWKGTAFLQTLLRHVLASANIPLPTRPQGLHIDRLYDATGACQFLVCLNTGSSPVDLPPFEDFVYLIGSSPTTLDPSGSALFARNTPPQ